MFSVGALVWVAPALPAVMVVPVVMPPAWGPAAPPGRPVPTAPRPAPLWRVSIPPADPAGPAVTPPSTTVPPRLPLPAGTAETAPTVPPADTAVSAALHRLPAPG